MKSLILEVELPESAMTTEYFEEIYAKKFADVAISRHRKIFPAYRKVAFWDLSDKKKGQCYRISWQNEKARPLRKEGDEPGVITPMAHALG